MAGHQFFKERCVEDFTILVFFTSAVLHDVVGFLLSQTLTQRHEDMVQLSTDHEAVFSFVVQLHALHEILVGSHILVFLLSLKMGKNSSSLNFLSPFFLEPPIFSMKALVGFNSRALRQSPKPM